MSPEEMKLIAGELLRTLAEDGYVIVPFKKAYPNAPLPAQDVYSIKNCAHVLGVSPHHIRRAILGGCLVASNAGTKNRPLYRVKRVDFDAWLKACESGPVLPKRNIPIVSRHQKTKKSSKASV